MGLWGQGTQDKEPSKSLMAVACRGVRYEGRMQQGGSYLYQREKGGEKAEDEWGSRLFEPL
jgi:hypothetical protein